MTDKKLAATAANENINFSEDAFTNNLTNGNNALKAEATKQTSILSRASKTLYTRCRYA